MANNSNNQRRAMSLSDAKNSFMSESLLRVLKTVFKRYYVAMIFVFIGILGASLATVQGTLFLQKLIDNHIVPMIGATNPDYASLRTAVIRLACIYVLGTICGVMHNRIMVNVGQGTMHTIRREMFEHMETLPIKYFDTHAHGDIMSLYTNDTDTLRQFIGQSFPNMINSCVSLINIFISMCVLNIPLTIIAVTITFLIVRFSGKLASRSGKYFIKQQKDLGRLNGYVEEMMSGAKVIKVFCHEEKSIEEFEVLNEELRSAAYSANSMANMVMPIVAQLGNLSYVIIAIVGATFALTGNMGVTIGTIVSFLSLNKGFNRPFMEMSQQLNSVVMAAAGATRIYSLIDEEPESDDGYVELVHAVEDSDGNITESTVKTGMWAWKHYHTEEGTTTYRKLNGEIVMEDVDFGYIPEKQVLKDINVFANKGQKIAFVGSTGAGKTTITNLINRFYDIWDGKIRYDGINITKIKKKDLRRSLGVVLQDTHLFSGTIMENIRYGRLDATDEECIAAAKLANAHGFINRLPMGYDTDLSGDGASLSQGQRQLIAIARAAVADPPALILDEATSSIDTRTEQLVQKGMDSLMNDRTTFVIAHRLSTVKNSNCIMVLEAGQIIERGSHEELLEMQGRYYQLYTGKSKSA